MSDQQHYDGPVQRLRADQIQFAALGSKGQAMKQSTWFCGWRAPAVVGKWRLPLAEGQKKIIEDGVSSKPKLDQTMARPRTITLPDQALAHRKTAAAEVSIWNRRNISPQPFDDGI